MRARCLLGYSFVALWLALPLGRSAAQADEPPLSSLAEQEKFFEERVRPVLVNRCFKCHGDKKQESGLRLDSRAAILAGADGGPVVEPGQPDKSPLIAAVLRAGDLKMPPDEKLPAAEVEVLTAWIQLGLPWPKENAASPVLDARSRMNHDRRTHWAYQKIRVPPPPEVKNQDWPATATDRFVLARLEASGLAPSPAVDRRALIRRVTFDLLGLPPTPAEVEEFVGDSSPDAYPRLVDRLLASPHYGVRWGRHWLDVARYADTRGYSFGKERKFPYAYTYRDYVISAFNADLPYDRFILEQLAADRLPPGDDKRPLAALGLLTVGRKYNNSHDDIDDQIDVVCRGLLGLTVGCARCHDHKYDAIPTEDYYSLYGVFASSKQPDELPLLVPPEETAGYDAFQKELDKLKAALEKFAAAELAELLDTARQRSAEYLARVASNRRESPLQKLPFTSVGRDDLRPKLIERWRNYLALHAKPDHAALGPWHDLLKLLDDGFAEQATAVLSKWAAVPEGIGQGQLNPLVKAALAAEAPQLKTDVAKVYGRLFQDAYAAWKQAGANAEALGKLPAEQRQLAELLLGSGAPTDISREDLREYLSREERNKYSELQKQIDSHQANSPGAPPRAMVLVDSSRPHEPRVFIRGNHARAGNVVPRQFVGVLSDDSRKPFTQGSGRLELAQAIVDPENPLTARVLVNRVWMHHFGQPLVNTPSDFGVRSEPPTHPELLDYLAGRFREQGWSLKALHRELLLSNVYQQASNDRPECRAVDPENRWLWRMNRRRLEFEALRDSTLAVAGRLDETLGGRPVEITNEKTRRRTVYGLIDRQDLPGLLRVFDFASPDQSSASRPRTTVPQQALFLMNAPFAVEQAKAAAARAEIAQVSDPALRIAALYRLLLGREPRSEETAVGLAFLEGAGQDAAGSSKLSPWEQYAQLLVLTNEFLYID